MTTTVFHLTTEEKLAFSDLSRWNGKKTTRKNKNFSGLMYGWSDFWSVIFYTNIFTEKKNPKENKTKKILSTENLITIEFQHTPFRIIKISKHFHFNRFLWMKLVRAKHKLCLQIECYWEKLFCVGRSSLEKHPYSSSTILQLIILSEVDTEWRLQ